jgi:hypothetical protein
VAAADEEDDDQILEVRSNSDGEPQQEVEDEEEVEEFKVDSSGKH